MSVHKVPKQNEKNLLSITFTVFFFRFLIEREIVLPESVGVPTPVSDGWLANPKRAIWPGRG